MAAGKQYPKLLPELFRPFREKYPWVTFDIFTATADLVKEQMDRGIPLVRRLQS
ncbi:hypothetical protein AALB53_10810 [Lachnospiraceae bacterium 47-T17]